LQPTVFYRWQKEFFENWSEKTEIGVGRFIGWLHITASKFYDWRERKRQDE